MTAIAWNCLRLTVDHGRRADLEKTAAGEMAAGAAFWVRIGSQLTRDADFDAWRKDFDKREALCSCCSPPNVFESRCRAKTGPLSITADAPVGPGGPGATRAETVSRRA